jgi:ubiquinone/menaquinone biosynthesis C-methylase UbiE
MTDTEEPRFTAAGFDRVHEAEARGILPARLAAEAYGEEYPSDVQPYGMTTKWVLGRLVSETLLGPDDNLVDLACGRGGPGLWLARATGARLVGVDWSASAVRLAQARIEEFLPAGRARFTVGDLMASGLPDMCADAVVCLDAVFFAPDVVAAMAEARRLLRPGGRYVFTNDIVPDSPDPARRVLDEHIEAAGLELVGKEVVPQFAERLQKMYDLWVEHVDKIAEDVGQEVADDMIQEAETVGPTLWTRTPYLVTARRPS